MSTIKSYLYENKIWVQVLEDDPDIKTRHRIVYSRNLTIYRNIDNQVTIEFRNNDQKPIDVTGKTFEFIIRTSDNCDNLYVNPITITDVNNAVGTTNITAIQTDYLTSLTYNYAIRYTEDGMTLPAYVDESWGAAGQIDVVQNSF